MYEIIAFMLLVYPLTMSPYYKVVNCV